MKSSGTITFNRWLVGGLAVACFVAAAVMWASSPVATGDAALWRFWWGGFLRGGVVLAAFWFCLPTKSRPAAWADFSPLSATLVTAALLLAILRPKIGLILLLAILAARALMSRLTRRR